MQEKFCSQWYRECLSLLGGWYHMRDTPGCVCVVWWEKVEFLLQQRLSLQVFSHSEAQKQHFTAVV